MKRSKARRFRRRWLAVLISIFGFVGTVFSSDSPWVLRTWQSDDGLPNNNVTALAQTPDGYLWMATPAKLARFDSVQFEGFLPRSIVPQFDKKITALLHSRKSGLWLGMSRGPVLCLNSSKIRVITNNIPNLVAEVMAEDRDGAIWIIYSGDRGGVLICIRGDNASQVLTGGGETRSLARDAEGRIWFTRDGQVGVFEDGKWAVAARLPSVQPTRLAAASAGGVWICSGLELFRCEQKNGLKRIGTLEPGREGSRPTVLLEDRSGAVWIGTSDNGLFRFADGRFENVPASHREILSLLEDREGNLWVGTGGGGLDRIRPRAIELEGSESGLPFEAVQSVCEDVHGVIWAATQNGLLACRTNGGWSTIAASADWPGGMAACVAADRDGAIWIGTQNHKLLRLQDGQFKTWEAQDGIVCRNIHSLLAARNGDVWIGGNAPDSLQRLRAGQLRNFELPPDVRVIRAMAEAADGTIWVASSKGILLRFTGDEMTDETARAGPELSIRSLHVSSDGSLWIGYAGWGLGRLKDGHFTRVTSAQGLYDDQISQIISDDRGWLWLGADHGIFKIRQEEFEAVAEGRAARLRSIRYGQSDGVPSLQANFGASPGALRSRDGRLWIPMRTALAVIDPEKVRQDLEPPAVLLKRVVVDDQVVASYGGAVPVGSAVDLQKPRAALRLSPGHRRLEFEFAALSFAAPENVSFQYRLDGFDENWVEGGIQRSAGYSRLAAGEYRFRVRACNRDGIWNTTGAGIALTVEPFLWQTSWFRLLALLTFTSVVIAIARYVSFRRLRLRLRLVEQQAALDKERARIARDIHDDLGCRLTKIALLTELAQQPSDPQDAIERVRQISITAREGMQSLDETVWAVNPRNDTLADLIDYVGQFAVEFLQSAGIRCSVDLPDHPPARAVSAEVRHNLFLAVKESLNNVVRHAHAGEVRVRVAMDENSLSVRIEDDGRGFDRAPDDAYADGLRNMRQRMEEIGGHFEIASKPGAGTRASFVYPWAAGR